MIAQVINLSNQKTLSSFKTEFNTLNELPFIPVLGVKFRDTLPDVASEFNNLIDKSAAIKLIPSSHNQSSLIVFRSLSDLIDIRNEIKQSVKSAFKMELNTILNNFISYNLSHYKVGKKDFKYNEPCIMAILNVTPDSFSDGGKFFERSKAIEQALRLIEDGADILDIGGESSRPGANEVSADEEINRVIPVIEEILKLKPETLVSVDTSKSKVARKALEIGAVMINDISGLTFDNKIADVAAEYNASLVIMHIKGTPRTMQVNPSYVNLIDELYDHLFLQCKKAELNGAKSIIIDPGIGFGKTVEQNYEILNRLDDFKSLGYPIMIGVSRKSFLGKTFNLEVTEREVPTIITETFSLLNGVSIIRTHSVKNAKQLTTIYKNLN